MKTGTCHFVNVLAAERYYKAQGEGFPQEAVKDKIKEGLIRIGPPLVRTNERYYIDTSEGRYVVENI